MFTSSTFIGATWVKFWTSRAVPSRAGPARAGADVRKTSRTRGGAYVSPFGMAHYGAGTATKSGAVAMHASALPKVHTSETTVPIAYHSAEYCAAVAPLYLVNRVAAMVCHGRAQGNN